jgi:hypothetical protein
MWTILLGPFISIFPKRWRELLPFSKQVRWGPAGAISGLAESMVALVALSYWYMYAMTAWVARGVESAMSGKMGPGVTDQAIGSVALVIWATHPLTLLLGYAGLEGAIRLCSAAFAGNVLGILPLFLLDKTLVTVFRRRGPKNMNAAANSPGNSSLLGALREKVQTATLPAVSDELCFKTSASENILEIRASRRKQDWIPPRIVRYRDCYYRLEADSFGSGPRPFLYTLRQLPAGVPGRTVLLYSPSDAVFKGAR